MTTPPGLPDWAIKAQEEYQRTWNEAYDRHHRWTASGYTRPTPAPYPNMVEVFARHAAAHYRPESDPVLEQARALMGMEPCPCCGRRHGMSYSGAPGTGPR